MSKKRRGLKRADGSTVRQRVEGICYREFRIDGGIEDEDQRLVRVSFSSEEPYLRRSWWEDPWIEVLGHDDGEVDLGRLLNGAPVLYNHRRTREDRIGVVREASVEGNRGIALLQISDRADVDDVWNDLLKGILCNTSVGYQIHERILTKQNDDGPDEYRVVLWEPHEISPVDIPADATVGVGRTWGPTCNYRVIDLSPTPAPTGTRQTEGSPMDGDEVTTEDTVTKEEAKKLAKRAASDALEAEATRRSEIRAAFEPHIEIDGARDLLDECLDDAKCTPAMANEKLLAKIGEHTTPVATGHFVPGADSADKFRDAAFQAIQFRANVPGVEEDAENPYRGFTMVELARASLGVNNLKTTGNRIEIIGRALTMRSAIGQSTSDFAFILLDVAHKSVLRGFSESGETWQAWCNVGNLSDFKQARRVGISAFEDLELVREGGEYKYGKFDDRGETIQLASYGKIFPITRQALINDDLGILTTIPMKMGRAAARMPGDLAYIALTSNPTMGDGVALFDAAHNNIGTSGVISAASVGEARDLMALQTDESSSANGLNTTLRHILVPVRLRDTADILRRSEYDPANAGNSRAPNPVQNGFEVTSDPRLTAASTTRWYGVADHERFDTVEVAFLDGVQEPRIEEENGWTVDGAEFKVGLDVAASPMEFRSFVRNEGV